MLTETQVTVAFVAGGFGLAALWNIESVLKKILAELKRRP